MQDPYFIIGCPRSGTTITMDIMSRHTEFAWISNYVNRLPRLNYLTWLNRIYFDNDFGDSLYYKATSDKSTPKLIQKALPHPVEPWEFWEKYLKNFRWKRFGDIAPRRRFPSDITNLEIQTIRNMVKIIMDYQNKKKFLSKYTDFPRMKYLLTAFPNAKFIHIIRDGNAVASSYHEKSQQKVFNSWNEREWWKLGWPQEWREEWDENDNSEIAFFAMQWRYFTTQILEESKEIPQEAYMEIRYSDFVASPFEVIEKVLAFCDLDFSRSVDEYLNKVKISNMNRKWEKRYSRQELSQLNRIIRNSNLDQYLDE